MTRNSGAAPDNTRSAPADLVSSQQFGQHFVNTDSAVQNSTATFSPDIFASADSRQSNTKIGLSTSANPYLPTTILTDYTGITNSNGTGARGGVDPFPGLSQAAETPPAPAVNEVKQGAIRQTDQYGTLLSSSDVSAANQGLTADQILTRAQTDSSHVLNAQTKQDFTDAIKASDDQFTAEDLATTKQLINLLASGKNPDGSPLSSTTRVQYHTAIAGELSNAESGYFARQAYFQTLLINKQYASAESVLKNMISVADNLPIDLAKSEATLLSKDMADPNVSRNVQLNLTTMYQSLTGTNGSTDDGMINAPITIRKRMAAFYIQGVDGSSTVLKPELAAQYVEEAKQKTAELLGKNADQSPDATLTSIARATASVMPDNLRKQKEQENSALWGPAAGASSAIIGAAILSVTAFIATKGKAGEVLPWLSKDVAGTTELSLAGKGVVGAVGFGASTVAEHYLNPLITGNSAQSWGASIVDAGAADGAVLTALGIRQLATKLLANGVTASGALATGGIKTKTINYATGYFTAMPALSVDHTLNTLDPVNRAGKPLTWQNIVDANSDVPLTSLFVGAAVGPRVAPWLTGRLPSVLKPSLPGDLGAASKSTFSRDFSKQSFSLLGTQSLLDGLSAQFLFPKSLTTTQIESEHKATQDQAIPTKTNFSLLPNDILLGAG